MFRRVPRLLSYWFKRCWNNQVLIYQGTAIVEWRRIIEKVILALAHKIGTMPSSVHNGVFYYCNPLFLQLQHGCETDSAGGPGAGVQLRRRKPPGDLHRRAPLSPQWLAGIRPRPHMRLKGIDDLYSRRFCSSTSPSPTHTLLRWRMYIFFLISMTPFLLICHCHRIIKWQNRKLPCIYCLHLKVALPRWRMS